MRRVVAGRGAGRETVNPLRASYGKDYAEDTVRSRTVSASEIARRFRHTGHTTIAALKI